MNPEATQLSRELSDGTVSELGRFLQSGLFSDLDRRFARFMVRQDPVPRVRVGQAAALLSYQLARGHIFLDLNEPPMWEDPAGAPFDQWPEPAAWMAGLRGSEVVGEAGDAKPFILTESGKLYLQRYWSYENLLAQKLRDRVPKAEGVLPPGTEERIKSLFGEATDQMEAARKALLRPFSLISGGPGTGKTTTVLKILVLLLEQDPDLVIHLAAPTGKAAARLQESVRLGLHELKCGREVGRQIAMLEASTLHRLLGAIPGSVFFRHNEKQPLAADLVVVDEASMVDLPLMAKLLAALPRTCRFILLGDKDQLASVEAGSVLSGIVEAALEAPAPSAAPPLGGSATLLTINYRFGNASPIFRICNAVRDGEAEAALAVFQESSPDLGRTELPAAGALKESLRARVVEGYRELLQQTEPAAALEAFSRFQILTPLRQGPYGKENLNRLVEEILREEGLVAPGKRDFPGRPLMVTENDYGVRLFNGDVGVLLEDEGGNLMAFFRREDGSIRKVSPLRLPLTDPAFAITVHKSQGSEFDEVLVLLPPSDARMLTRELVYTAISRARRGAEIWSTEDVLRRAIGRKVTRACGLSEMLTATARRRLETGAGAD